VESTHAQAHTLNLCGCFLYYGLFFIATVAIVSGVVVDFDANVTVSADDAIGVIVAGANDVAAAIIAADVVDVNDDILFAVVDASAAIVAATIVVRCCCCC